MIRSEVMLEKSRKLKVQSMCGPQGENWPIQHVLDESEDRLRSQRSFSPTSGAVRAVEDMWAVIGSWLYGGCLGL